MGKQKASNVCRKAAGRWSLVGFSGEKHEGAEEEEVGGV